MVHTFLIHTVLAGKCKLLYARTFHTVTSLPKDKSGHVSSDSRKQQCQHQSGNGRDSDSVSDTVSSFHRHVLTRVMEEVQSQYLFRTALSGRSYGSYAADLQKMQNEGKLPGLELGYFHLETLNLEVSLPLPLQTPKCSSSVTGETSQERPNAGREGKHNEDPHHEPDEGDDPEVDSDPVGPLQDKLVLWLAAMNCSFTLILDEQENRLLAEKNLRLLIKHLQEHCRVFDQPSNFVSKPERAAAVVDQVLPNGLLVFCNHRLSRQWEKQLELKLKSMVL